MIEYNEVVTIILALTAVAGTFVWIINGEVKDDDNQWYIYRIQRDYADNANLEVSDRESCSMCDGNGAVVATPGRGKPYMQVCEYCGGCGKMGS